MAILVTQELLLLDILVIAVFQGIQVFLAIAVLAVIADQVSLVFLVTAVLVYLAIQALLLLAIAVLAVHPVFQELLLQGFQVTQVFLDILVSLLILALQILGQLHKPLMEQLAHLQKFY